MNILALIKYIVKIRIKIMKKLCFILVFFVFCCFFSFGDTGDQAEEIDFLLFLPNSSNQFANEEQAVIQLDNLAKYLTDRDLYSGQIYVIGYAAAAQNDIEPIGLSRDRALFVINELQKRGVSSDLFSEPAAYGSVDLWGSNASEEDRSPNRRVRVMLDGSFLTPAAMQAADSEVKPASTDNTPVTPVREETVTAESGSKFPWIILLPLILIPLIAAIIFLASKKRRNSTGTGEVRDVPVPDNEPIANEPMADEPIAVSVQTISIVVDLDEEIRRRAYELYEQRNGQDGDAEGDWYMAVCDICPRYEADGYRCNLSAGSWQASRTSIR